VKPDNVFLTTSGEVKVLDFGIGRFFESSDPTSATRSGRAVGTPAFMAPEQALGRTREVDGRTDLFAVGAMMFHLASRQLVHEAETGGELLAYAATRRARSLGSVAPDLPRDVIDLVDRALAFEKTARWSDAGEMRAAVRAAFHAAFPEEIDAV